MRMIWWNGKCFVLIVVGLNYYCLLWGFYLNFLLKVYICKKTKCEGYFNEWSSP